MLINKEKILTSEEAKKKRLEYWNNYFLENNNKLFDKIIFLLKNECNFKFNVSIEKKFCEEGQFRAIIFILLENGYMINNSVYPKSEYEDIIIEFEIK
jgi:hypothetical protein